MMQFYDHEVLDNSTALSQLESSVFFMYVNTKEIVVLRRWEIDEREWSLSCKALKI